MLQKLAEMELRYQELEELLQKSETIKNITLYSECRKEHGALSRVVPIYRDYKKVLEQIKENQALAKDPDFYELAQEEIKELEKKRDQIYEHIQDTLLSSENDGDKNVIVEIRAGTGGEEAALFARDLFEMYTRFAERRRWKIEILDSSASDLSGIREISFAIKGKSAYSLMKHETGGHRVQRIPVTESSGRIHTSACTVVVLPEAEEVEVDINPIDLEIDFKRASGPGGQNVNKTSSAVRITHKPTGIVVTCQETPEQHKNRAKAMRVLLARLYQRQQEKLQAERNALRKTQGSGDRSDRIRTYNFPQNRVTDHRINVSIYNLEVFMQGDIGEMLEQLQKYDRQKRLENLQGIVVKREVAPTADDD